MSAASRGSPVRSNSAACRSSAALTSHARVSAARAGSCGIEELSLVQHRRRERGRQVRSAVKLSPCPAEHICGGARAPETFVGQTAAPPGGGGLVGGGGGGGGG